MVGDFYLFQWSFCRTLVLSGFLTQREVKRALKAARVYVPIDSAHLSNAELPEGLA